MRFIQNLKIMRKLLLNIFIFLLFLLFLIIICFQMVSEQRKAMENLTNVRFELYKQASSALEAVLILDRTFEIAVITNLEAGLSLELATSLKKDIQGNLSTSIEAITTIINNSNNIDVKEREKFEYTLQQLNYYKQTGINMCTFSQVGGGNGLKALLTQINEASTNIKKTVMDLKKYEDQKIVEIKDTVEAESRRRFLQVLIIAILAITIPVILTLLVSYVIVTPIQKLVNFSKEIAEGNRNAACVIDTKDEMGTLSTHFNEMIVKIDEAAAKVLENENKLANERLEKEVLGKEMDIAQRIQTVIVPHNPKDNDFEIAACMKPAEKVGGDYYDYFVDDKGFRWFAIGDVSGHGVTPGLIMMMAQTSFITTLSGEIGRKNTPKDAFDRVNKVLTTNVKDRLCKKTEEQQKKGEKEESYFMTMSFLKYLNDGNFEFAGKHLDIIIYRKATKTIELVGTYGLWLGLIKDSSKVTRNDRFHLNIGDIMLLHTDGVDESRHAIDRSLMGVEAIHKTMIKNADKGVNCIMESVKEKALEWCDYHPDDDITMLVVERKV